MADTTMADTLTLFCLVDGQSTSHAFPVEISRTKTVGGLKDAIVSGIQAPAFKGIAAKDLTLWRVSIPEIPGDENKQIWWQSLAATHDPALLPLELNRPRMVVSTLDNDDTTYILIQLPAPAQARPSDTSPPGRPLSVPLGPLSPNQPRPVSPANISEDLDKITGEFFSTASQYSIFLDEFVQGSHALPVTEGSISGLPCVGQRGLARPRTAPSLMFFDLPSLGPIDGAHNQAEKILSEFPGTRHLPLFGVSGCGKTRTAVDLLSRTWGLYFNAGAADYGSGDMHTLVQALSSYDDIYVTEDIRQNTNRIRCLTYGLLYARLLILEHCLNLTGSRDTFCCQRWMLLQVATPAFEDVFQRLFKSVSAYIHIRLRTSTILNSDMLTIMQDRFKKVQELLHHRSLSSGVHSKFLVILDESQVLGRLFSEAFIDSDLKTIRPVLAPVLFAFRRLTDSTSDDVCVMPCGTGLSAFELTWLGGSASGTKLPRDQSREMELSDMVVDFAGWTDVGSISCYLDRVREGLDDGGKRRLDELIPEKAIEKLFRHLRGRFRPIISAIEDIIREDGLMVWEECIHEREDQLTTASIPTTDVEKRRLDGNLCGELRRVFEHVRHDRGSVAFAEFHNVEASLKLAIATFVTQGGTMAFKGQLPKLVETAFGRIKLIGSDFYTTIDEPFALLAADNYFQSIDPDYCQFRQDQLERAPTEQTRGKEWECSLPFEMVHVFNNKKVSARLFHSDEAPHSMFLHKASVVGWTGLMRTTSSQEMTMDEFLDAHVNNKSERDGQSVPPFFYPKEHVSGPDIVFVVRFNGLMQDGTQASSSTTSPDSASSEIICPVLVQAKLCEKLSQYQVARARSTVQPKAIKGHSVELSQFCQPHGYYISLIVSYPFEIADFFMDRPLEKHKGDLTEIALVIDDNNIDDLFSEKHVQALKHMKRLAAEMARATKEVKRRRVEEISRSY